MPGWRPNCGARASPVPPPRSRPRRPGARREAGPRGPGGSGARPARPHGAPTRGDDAPRGVRRPARGRARQPAPVFRSTARSAARGDSRRAAHAGRGPPRAGRLQAVQAVHGAQEHRLRLGQPPRRAGLRGRGPRGDRGPQGRALRRRGGRAAHQDDRGDGLPPRRRLHLQRGEVPAAGQPQPGAGRDRRVRAVPARAAARGAAQGHRRAGQVRGADAAARHHAHHQDARARGANTRASS